MEHKDNRERLLQQLLKGDYASLETFREEVSEDDPLYLLGRRLADQNTQILEQRQQIEKREEGINSILGLLIEIADGNFSFDPQLDLEDELLEALHVGLNMMAEELAATHAALKEARDEALAASAYKSSFLASMSHELRTPLTAIIGYSEMLREDAVDQGMETVVSDTSKILSAANHLLKVISNILDLSKIEAGKIELDPQLFPVSALIRELESTITPLILKKDNQFSLHIDEELESVYNDRTKLSQVLLNLLSNASKFTDTGTIELHARLLRDEEHLLIAFDVVDSGIGIAPDRQAAIFQPFTQQDESTTRYYGGTGLGLTISRSFCRLMGGDLTVTSTQGVGSTFTATILQRLKK